MKLHWSHAVLHVRDLDAMIAFYRDVLGFQISDRGHIGGAQGLELAFLSQVGSDHHQLAFIPVRGAGGGRGALDHMAFRVASFADVTGLIARLRADGRATDLNPINHGNAWSIYFKDPEGNGLEVFCDTPWHVRQPQAQPWDPAIDEAEMRRRTAEQFGAEPDFGPMEEFLTAQRRRHGD